MREQGEVPSGRLAPGLSTAPAGRSTAGIRPPLGLTADETCPFCDGTGAHAPWLRRAAGDDVEPCLFCFGSGRAS